ncbi:YggS family pyridoxal phosphate-dependent enzyme [Desertibacillus haloalkaliphilus]|uniref:YggS family pyridoxal phosphate-dependent enzyme n=1 Tax=Desertibacillus haloalkaliphilus TaxID=1328930 RepID=UPI001C262B90|nr:YggS family pyridoxal phosphate-dependent enzyme [Desertibacillus haloalkaliphilus]MBU8907096.1 YggS family pyridoxal phosphate-dependent enzyme [Desertibacillus haloalkaliphilus]
MTVQENLQTINEQIHAACQRVGRDPKEVKVIAVTKYVSEETTREALDAGIEHIGENRVEGGLDKWEALGSRGTWHFIGSLQSKKVKKVIGKFTYFHSLDRISLAKEIQKRAEEDDIVRCFVQVNVSGEESKAGLEPDEVIEFIESLAQFPAIKVVGLMTMAPFVEDIEETRPVFRGLCALQKKVQALHLSHAPCDELSMGMSNDYTVAIEEGATFIRLGSSLVGNEMNE